MSLKTKIGTGLTTAVLLVVGSGAIFLSGRAGSRETDHATFQVRQGTLEIKVLEGGNVESLESQEIKSEIKGWQGVKILSIVEEGYYVTEEDVAQGLILVELDTSEIKEKLTTSEIQYKGTQASLIEAEQGYGIQVSKSESEIYEAELEVKFAKLELEKYLGEELTLVVMDKVADFEEEMGFTEEARSLQTVETAQRDLIVSGSEGPVAQHDETSDEGEADVELFSTAFRQRHPEINFKEYAKPSLLGQGEANQKLRKLEDELLLAKKEWRIAQTRYEGTGRLFERDFVTSNDLENDLLDVEKKKISIDAAQTAERLFVRYEFPKQAEKLLSDHVQGQRKLERTRKRAISETAKARAKWLSTEARANIERERIKGYTEQIEKGTMRAEIPGLVVFGGGQTRYWNSEPIKEGATIRERQTIITIPDTKKMAVKTKIHESAIKRVKKGQKARIRVEAFQDRPLVGEVIKVAVLPDSEDRWMNPDLKVYETTIKIDGDNDWLKPGMSAEVEIFVETIRDALYVPLQSIVPQGRDQVCYVMNRGKPEPRVVETGQMTVSYIEIKSGLEEGERVLIRPPEGSRNDVEEDEVAAEGPPPDTDEETPQADEPSQTSSDDATSSEDAEELPSSEENPSDTPTA